MQVIQLGKSGDRNCRYFYEYSDIVPAGLLDELTQHAITYINETSLRKDFHELLCCLRFAELVPGAVLSEVRPALDEMVENCVTTIQGNGTAIASRRFRWRNRQARSIIVSSAKARNSIWDIC